MLAEWIALVNFKNKSESKKIMYEEKNYCAFDMFAGRRRALSWQALNPIGGVHRRPACSLIFLPSSQQFSGWLNRGISRAAPLPAHLKVFQT
jgi:hypothetical protein